LIAAVIVVAAITNASAFEVRAGKFVAYQTVSNDGGRVPICGIQTSWPQTRASLHIKYVLGDDVLRMHLFKESWRFPRDGSTVDIPLVVGFDKNAMLDGTAKGSATGPVPLASIRFDSTEQALNFLQEFGEADKMWIRFEAGNEPLWVVDMTGSRDAVKLFRACVASITAKGKLATQPYGNGGTQPYGNGGTQPFGQPKPQTAPAAKKDNAI
jgi:hypothetical protein